MSDGKWSVEKIIRVDVLDKTVALPGRYITGSTSGAIAGVEKQIIQTRGGYSFTEFILNSSSMQGDFAVGEILTYVDDNGNTQQLGNIRGLENDLTITDSGFEYELGDEFIVNRVGDTVSLASVPSVDSGTYIRVKVEEITGGIIDEITVINGGSGYSVYDEVVFDNSNSSTPTIQFGSARAQVIEVDGGGAITKIRMLYTGRGYVKFPLLSVGSVGGTGAVLEPVGTGVGSICRLSVANPGYLYTTDIQSELETTIENDTKQYPAIIDFNIGTCHVTDGKFLSEDGQLSAGKYIIDSYFYQDFSYVIRVGLQTSQYRDIIKRLVHPAGMIFFGEVLLLNEVQMKMQSYCEYILQIILELDVRMSIEEIVWCLLIELENSLKIKFNETTGATLPTIIWPDVTPMQPYNLEMTMEFVETFIFRTIVLDELIREYRDIVINQWNYLAPWTDYRIKKNNLKVSYIESELNYEKQYITEVTMAMSLTETPKGMEIGTGGDITMIGIETETNFISDFNAYEETVEFLELDIESYPHENLPNPFNNHVISVAETVQYEFSPTNAVTGTVSTNGTDVITGSGTSFLTDVSNGDTIIIGNEKFIVENVDNNTQITTTVSSSNTASGLTLYVESEFN